MNNKLLYIFTILGWLLSASSCVDDRLYDPDEIGEGMSTVTAEVSFDNMPDALTRATTGGSEGNAINDMTGICVLLYKSDGSILKDKDGNPRKFYFSNVETEIPGQNKPSDEINPDDPESAHWAQTAETSTVKTTVSLADIPYGKYKMYAIANVPNSILTDEIISDIEKVKNLHFAWDDTNIAVNNQMFGYFSDDNSSKGFEAPFVVIKQPNQKLHAWVKRLASKVTVAFDARNLKADINIYLISATIKDIPANCFLGKENSPGSYEPADNEMNELISNGQTIMYVDDPEGTPLDDNWPAIISNRNPIFGFNTNVLDDAARSWDEKLEAEHGENVNALYFYENIQGNGVPGTASDKWQVVQGSEDITKPSYPDGNTIPDGSDASNPEVTGYKDNKIHGSYVEVKAYYISNNPTDISRGNITYRFMLGKDTHTDFNAERNHHYKVTLCFNGFANDIDWHIDFDQTPEIVGPTPCNISYLYNQSMNYSFTVVGGKLKKLTAQIPVNDITKGSWHPKNGEVTIEDEAAAASVGGSVYWTGTVNDPGPWNGFLSLRKTTEAEYGSIAEGYRPDNSNTYTLNKLKFYGSYSFQPQNNAVYNLGYREYRVDPGEYIAEAGSYSIVNNSPGVWTVTLSLFTRPRVMTAQTGYTGNNPYVAYNRMSQVIFSATVEKADGTEVTVSKTIDVKQARRVVNPKAVWRKSNSVKPFHVQLKIRKSQTSATFSNLISDGPWKAEVICGKDWISLTPTEHSQTNPDGSISGIGNQYDSENEAGRTIDFKLAPKGSTITPRGGIIRVTYDNFSCVHNIFVRQGYDPVQFYGKGPLWHTGNLLTGGDDISDAIEVDEPQFEGSYFRKYNRLYPIDASSNTAPIPYKVVDGLSKEFKIAGTNETKLWEEIKPVHDTSSWGEFKVNGTPCRLPSEDDWNVIINDERTIYGFGVLYGDDATETKDAISEVYGADSNNPEYGMRGVIVCDESSGTQLFLPIAASGYGRIKQKFPKTWYDNGTLVTNDLRLEPGWGGVVQYANRYTWFTSTDGYRGISYKPLFYDIFTSQGTLYWLDQDRALDVNYLTLGFSIGVDNPDGLALVYRWPVDPSGSDAIHLRLVHDPPAP